MLQYCYTCTKVTERDTAGTCLSCNFTAPFPSSSPPKPNGLTTQAEFLELFRAEIEAQLEITTAKNKDYAGAEDAFKNFRAIELLSGGKITAEMGILVRMTDKFQRIINLLLQASGPAVQDEKIEDTCRDLAVYTTILKIFREQKHRQEQLSREPGGVGVRRRSVRR